MRKAFLYKFFYEFTQCERGEKKKTPIYIGRLDKRLEAIVKEGNSKSRNGKRRMENGIYKNGNLSNKI